MAQLFFVVILYELKHERVDMPPDEVEFTEGLDAPQPLALGLGPAQLVVVVSAAAVAYALLRSPIPAAVSGPLVLFVGAVAAVLGWVRFGGRPALEWSIFVGRYAVGPRYGRLAFASTARPHLACIAADPHVPAAAAGAAPRTLSGRVIPLRPYLMHDAPALEHPLSRASVLPARMLRASAHPVRSHAGHSRRIVFFSLRGGSGKTTLATELACLLARTDGTSARERLSVALLDLDTRSPSVAMRLGIVHKGLEEFAGAAIEHRRAADFMTRHETGLRVLVDAGNQRQAAWPYNRDLARELLREMDMEGIDVVVCDVASQLCELTAEVLVSADDVFVVFSPTVSGVQDAYRTTEALRRIGLRHQLRYVLNRVGAHADVGETMRDLDGEVVAEIPEDAAAQASEDAHGRIADSTGPAAASLQRFARRIRRDTQRVHS